MASRSRGSRRDRKRGHRGFHDANDVGSNGDANMGRGPSDAAVPGVSDRDLEEERKHYYEVAQSLLEYAICMQPEVVRRRRQVERLSPHYTELLYVCPSHAAVLPHVRTNASAGGRCLR